LSREVLVAIIVVVDMSVDGVYGFYYYHY
jgi:hypothetical protein